MARLLDEGSALDAAVAILSSGGLVAIPTETVYGLAADAANGAAVARIFEAKGRPRFNPLIAHVADREMADSLASFDALSSRLADAFWPGPLTLVLPRRRNAPVHPLVSAELDTLALRIPRGFGGELIARLGRAIAAPSANSSGRVSTTTARAVQRDLGNKVDLIVDGGPTSVGVESTIVKIAGGRLHLLRPGGIAAAELEAVAGVPVERGGSGGVDAPGQLASHYAPNAAVRLDVAEVRPGEALLAFGPLRARGADAAAALRNLSPSGDLREAAANLFTLLHELDGSNAPVIAVEPIPAHGLGEAINDRLRRAAAPRHIPVVNERA